MGIYRRVNIKALALGALVDIGGSAIAGLIIGVAIGIYYGVMDVPGDEILAQLQGSMLLVPNLLLGAGFIALGGYIAGRTARADEVLHGGLVGVISLLFGLFFWGDFPLWYSVVGLLIAIPFGIVGGRVAASSNREEAIAQ